MQDDVGKYINACPICRSSKPLTPTKAGSGVLSSSQLFHMVSLDHIGPRTFGEERFYILVMVDHYSRYMVTAVCKELTATTTVGLFRDHWVSKFGAPKVVLTDRGTSFTSLLFKNYIVRNLGSSIYYSSTEYPQGNGINESSHRILETAIKTRAPSVGSTFEDIVAEATLLYNVTPNRTIGDTPASLTFGMDLHIPGLDELEVNTSEEARLLRLREYKGFKLLLHQLEQIEKEEELKTFKEDRVDFEIGDVVAYTLSTYERGKTKHYTRENKYSPTMSFPQRVIKVTNNTLVVVPLWTVGRERTVPKHQCKRLTTFIPETFRRQLKELYPHMKWTSEDNLTNEDLQLMAKTKDAKETDITPSSDIDDRLESAEQVSRGKRSRREDRLL